VLRLYSILNHISTDLYILVTQLKSYNRVSHIVAMSKAIQMKMDFTNTYQD